MTDHDRDLVVARALRDLPVPDHGPGFWEQLETRLAAEDQMPFDEPSPRRIHVVGRASADERITTSELPAVTALQPDPGPSRRQRARFLAVAATIAIIAITAGLVLRGDGDDGSGTRLADQPSSTATPPGEVDTMQLPAVTSVPAPIVAPSVRAVPATPEDAVLLWVQALADGDLPMAEALLGPRTVRSMAAADMNIDDFTEGYGSWTTSGDLAMTDVELPGVGAVVVLQGTRAPEGMVEYAVKAIPTVEADGGWLVEPMTFDPSSGPQVELLAPTPQEQEGMLSGERPDVVVEAMSSDPSATLWFSIDGAAAVPSDGTSWDPPGSLDNGTHLLVVVAVGDDVFAAVAGEFTVEG